MRVEDVNDVLQEKDHGAVLLMLGRFGSQLYGTDTPNSDEDYKGVYLPSKEAIILKDKKRVINFGTPDDSSKKNTNEDIDGQLIPLSSFMKLLYKQDMVALDMLHTNTDNLLFTTHQWERLSRSRNHFYVKDMRSSIGYIMGQAAKYGIKGSRLASAKAVKEHLSFYYDNQTMQEVWHNVPLNAHVKMNLESDPPYLDVCGKKIQGTAKVGYALGIINNFIDQYGHRAIQAEKDEGIDWKAISHALRATYQVMCIYTKGGFEYPLENAEFLRDVKVGVYTWNQIKKILEVNVEEVMKLSTVSTLPDEVDTDYWNHWLVSVYAKQFNRN